MFRNLNNSLIYEKEFNDTKLLTKEEIKKAIDLIIKQVDQNIDYFGKEFMIANTFNNKYQKIYSSEWTDGFWTGILWLAYEYTNNNKYKELALEHVKWYKKRIKEKILVDHHDMGFLYSPSCVAAYKLTKNQEAKEAALLAADNLISRYQEKGKFIQAWGNIGANDNYRLIIDCLLNIPLLYWASDYDRKNYFDKALNHFNTSLHTVIREDGTTYHTYFFDAKTNKPLCGKTRQGYSDDSCWARGQAWGIYGIPLTLKYAKNNSKIDKNAYQIYQKVLNQFLNNLPQDDYVCYWDLIFNEKADQSRDSSASAIAVCGILEMLKITQKDYKTDLYEKSAHLILRNLINKYHNKKIEPGTPILLHGVYSWHSKKGVDEGNIWGDYYYFEALMRLYKKDWNPYW
ncbi:glycoside hydrolase family 88 protein [Mycoplasmopsis fermentans]|uniref:glycoside hydrolase family 88 protein n=1 Tax=Mycoplasmopsis fermentans TaxID=2115 RepID=UPI000F03201C|nr:glycoside hydrolase family 88 protein [Mycoplasmopsis fermentans]RMX35288.1 unsaturated glucuronyl hydrolase [Mycoplasmopsis fermentans MF-I2]RMX35426.1 unsaturated glucuronyl hydrolase [Mycoplasmopsis fermentans MF-I1]